MVTTQHLAVTDLSAMNKFYMRRLTNLKILCNKIKLPWKKKAHEITEIR
jgi:hypothetical protein